MFNDYRDQFPVGSRIRNRRTGDIGVVVDISHRCWLSGHLVKESVTYRGQPNMVWAEWYTGSEMVRTNGAVWIDPEAIAVVLSAVPKTA